METDGVYVEVMFHYCGSTGIFMDQEKWRNTSWEYPQAVVQSNYYAKMVVNILPLAYIMKEMDVTCWCNQPPTITERITLIRKH